jgi:hypothetical protein
LGLALALWQRRPKESMVYILGLVGWAVYYGLHCWKVSQLITATAGAHPHGWVQFGGLTLVIAMAQMNSCLVLLPVWVTVIYFALAMVGFAGCRAPWAVRTTLTACIYVTAFSIVGQEFNRYWGLMIAPLFCFGVVRSPAALSDLWHAAKLPLPQKLSYFRQFGKPRSVGGNNA